MYYNIAILLLLLVIGGIAFYWVKHKRTKPSLLVKDFESLKDGSLGLPSDLIARIMPYHDPYDACIALLKSIQVLEEENRILEQYAHEVEKEGKTYKISALDQQKLLEDAKYYKGGKYVWGGTTPEGFDCSGYVQYLYKKHNINLPRTAWAQSKKGIDVSRDQLQKGDLLFFLTDKKRGIPVTHVGIYIGEGKFIHAASKEKGIIISPITHGSYARTFVSAKRVTPQTS
jgi:hypothetical protein